MAFPDTSVALWYEADDPFNGGGTPSDGATITASSTNVKNKGSKGAAGDLVAGTCVYKTGVINSRSVFRFNGTSHVLTSLSGLGLTQNTTVFIVAQAASGASGFLLDCNAFADATNRQNVNYKFSGGSDLGMYAGTLFTPAGTGTWASATRIIECIFNGASSKLFINGTQIGAASAAGASSIGSIALGAEYDVSPNNYIACDIAAVIVHDNTSTAGHLTDTFAYLAGKYGPPLVAGTITYRPGIGDVYAKANPSGGFGPYTTYAHEYSSDGSSWTPYGANTQEAHKTGVTPGQKIYLRCTITDSVSSVVTTSTVLFTCPTKIAVIDGNSIDANYHVDTSQGSSAIYGGNNPVGAEDGAWFTSLVKSQLGADWGVYDYAYASRPLGSAANNPTGHTQIGDYPTNVSPKVVAAIAAGYKCVVFMGLEPGNDGYWRAAGAGVPAAIEADVLTYRGLVVADGGYVAAVTIPQRANGSGANNTGLQSDLVTYNTWLAANKASVVTGDSAAGFQDLRADAAMQDATNATYYDTALDGSPATHLKYAGSVVEAPYVVLAIKGAMPAPPPPTPGSGTSNKGWVFAGTPINSLPTG